MRPVLVSVWKANPSRNQSNTSFLIAPAPTYYAAPGLNAHRAFILATCSTAGQRSILRMSKSTFIATFTGRIVSGSTVTPKMTCTAPPLTSLPNSPRLYSMQCSPGVLETLPRDHTPHQSLATRTNPILSTATTFFTRAAKSAHFLADREEKRLSIMYHGWTPSPSPTDKWEAAWLESGAFCNQHKG